MVGTRRLWEQRFWRQQEAGLAVWVQCLRHRGPGQPHNVPPFQGQEEARTKGKQPKGWRRAGRCGTSATGSEGLQPGHGP